MELVYSCSRAVGDVELEWFGCGAGAELVVE